MNKRRLLKMADFVETIPRKEFDMGEFGGERDCGTVGCAIGWAAHKRLFHGLRVRNPQDWLPRYGDRDGFFAIGTLFDIESSEAAVLFSWEHNNATPKQVARNIRRYVETGELP